MIAAKAELPATLFLRRERKRHQDTDLDHSHRQSAAHACKETGEKKVEFLRTGYRYKTNTHALHQHVGVPRRA